ncbi:MAG: hypothetical protein ACK481_02605 [Candidatus Melainabacteria bacterium]|jgi:hypothetical protein
MEFYDYFQTNVNYFWSWEEGTELLSIDGGHTIAYRKHISAILDYLSEYGIPPFGSLLLVIIATNNTFGNSLMLVEKIV